MKFGVIALIYVGIAFFLALQYPAIAARRFDRARCRRTAEARGYQQLMREMPDVIWTDEIYRVTFNF